MSGSGIPAIEEFRAEARNWLEAELTGAFADVRGSGGPGREHELIDRRREWERRLGEGGWIGLGWPHAAGGRALPLQHQVVFHEEYARAGGPGRLLHISEQLLAPTLLAFGTEDQQKQHLPGILRGETLWCQGYSEPGAGSDLAAVSTRAERVDDDYVLHGQKVWTSLAHVASWCFVVARTEPGSTRHAGLSFLLVPMDQPGITVRPIVQITGTSEFNEVFFDGARTGAGNLVGAEGDGWKVAMSLLGFERGVSTLGQQVGFRREFVEVLAAARHAGVWDRDGRPADPALVARLERSWLDLAALRAVAEGTLTSFGSGASGLEASISKLLWATWHRDLGEIALDVAGVEGITTHPGGDLLSAAQTLFLFSRSDTIYGGSNEIQRNILAERLLGMPREGSEAATSPQVLSPRWDPSDGFVRGEVAREIRTAVREVLDETTPRPVRGFDEGAEAALLELGVASLAVPESLGGLGLGWEEAAAVGWELGRHLASTTLLDTLVVSGWLAETPAADAILQRYAAHSPAVAIAGVTGGPALRTAEDGSVRLHGTCPLVPWGGRADWFLLPVDDRVWLVEAGAPGLEVVPRGTLDPTRELVDVNFDQVTTTEVPGDPSLLVARWRALAAVEAAGSAHRALTDTVRYLGQRRQFGRVLASYQALKHRAADLVATVAGAAALAGQGLDQPELAAVAKVVAADALTSVAAEELQLHGGVGFTDEYDVHLHLKRGKTVQSLGGRAADLRSAALASIPTDGQP